MQALGGTAFIGHFQIFDNLDRNEFKSGERGRKCPNRNRP